MSGPFLPISSRHDGGIDIHIHSDGRPANCQIGVKINHNPNRWDDDEEEAPCHGCVYIPGQDSARLIEWDPLDPSDCIVNPVGASLLKCFNKVYVDVDFIPDLDFKLDYADEDRVKLFRAAHVALARLVTLLNPLLQNHDVRLNFMNADAMSHQRYFRNQLRVFSSWRCQQFTVLNAPDHSLALARTVRNEVIGDRPSNDLYQQLFEVEHLPVEGIKDEPLKSQITAMYRGALGRNPATFRTARTQALGSIQRILDDIANTKQRLISTIP